MTKRETCQLCTRRRVNEALAPLTDAEAGAIQAVSEVETLRRALEFIAAWDRDKFPRVPDRDDPTKTYSYGLAYGSNGERDYMRTIARKALDGNTPTTRVFTEAEVREALKAHAGLRHYSGQYAVDALARTLGLTLD